MLNKSLLLSVSLLCTLLVSLATFADGTSSAQSPSSKSPATIQCPVSAGQPDTFALCAAASCWSLDNVAYCKCDVMNEKSISLTFEYTEHDQSKTVCDLLLQGVQNGFTVSTYATPRQGETDYNPAKEKLGPPQAFYTCPNNSGSDPAYSAQCDGGICFKSTQGQRFPGLGHIGKDEIVCSCPPFASPPNGFQIAGPWLCEPGDANENNKCCSQKYYDDMCSVTSVQTGTRMKVGAGIGNATLLSTILDGSKPNFNQCSFATPKAN